MGKIQELAAQRGAEGQRRAGESAMAIFNSILDRDGYRRRFEELLGNRTPQFLSALVSVVNGDDKLREVVFTSPVSIIQAALKSATYDLPIDPDLGMAYIIARKNKKKNALEAKFTIGYKGYIQLALRTSEYNKLNVVDIREGELIRYDRLKEEIEIEFIDDDDLREKQPIIGYAGYYKLNSGMEKIIYWSVAKIRAHESKTRQGEFMNPIWRTDFDAMSRKTVLKNMIDKWGLKSITYKQNGSNRGAMAAQALLEDMRTDSDEIIEATMEPERGEPDGIQAQFEQMNQQEEGK